MYSSLIIERHYKISIMFIVTIVTVWAECCCKLVHMKVHDQDFMLMCHLQYSVQKFSIHGEHEYNMSNSVLTISQGQSSAPRVHKHDRMFYLPWSYRERNTGNFFKYFFYVPDVVYCLN